MASTVEIKRKAKAKFTRYAAPRRRLSLNYDRPVDVLYVNFTRSKPQRADLGRRKGDYILRFKADELVGITVLNAGWHSITGFGDFTL